MLHQSRNGLALMLVIFAMAFSLPYVRAEAANATLSVSATGAKVGETVNVTVSAKSNDYIGYIYVILNYDATILQAPESDSISGGSGTITFIIGSDTADVKEASATISFTALKAGTSTLAFDSGTWGIDNNGDSLTLTTSGSSVKVTSAYTASTDATLSSLKVTGTTDSGSTQTIALSPSFSKNTTSYTATVESDVTKVVTTAAANDSKATVSISDTSLTLETGTNTVTVKVTAESGATKTYTVTITKEEAETTTQEPTTEETTTEEETTEEETTEAETTTVVDDDTIYVTIDGEQRILLREFDEILLPEGFEITEISWEGEVIHAGKGIYKDLTLVCTADINGEHLRLYILQEDGSFLILRNYQTNAVLYTLLDLPEQDAPEGFQKTTIILGTDYAENDEVEAWQSLTSPDYYLVYAMNWDGETGYYLYDSLEGTFQRYDAEDWQAEETTTEAETESETETVTEEITTEEMTTTEPATEATPVDATPTDDQTADDDTGSGSSGVWKYVVMLLEAVAIVVLAAALVRANRNGKKPSGGNPGGDGPDGTQPGGGIPGENDPDEKIFGRDSLDGTGISIENNDGLTPDEIQTAGGILAGIAADGMQPGDENFAGMTPDEMLTGEEKSGGIEPDRGDEELPGVDSMSLNEYFSDFDEILAGLDREE